MILALFIATQEGTFQHTLNWGSILLLGNHSILYSVVYEGCWIKIQSISTGIVAHGWQCDRGEAVPSLSIVTLEALSSRDCGWEKKQHHGATSKSELEHEHQYTYLSELIFRSFTKHETITVKQAPTITHQLVCWWHKENAVLLLIALPPYCQRLHYRGTW